MDAWMPEFIREREEEGVRSLSEFAKALRDALDSEMHPSERRYGSIVHFAGYGSGEPINHPEFWHIRNVHGIDPLTGDYEELDGKFAVNEDFWERDLRSERRRRAFAAGLPVYYINGVVSGRAMFNRIFGTIVSTVWDQPSWGFQLPQSGDDMTVFVEKVFSNVNMMFAWRTHGQSIVGGALTHVQISPPPELRENWWLRS